MGQYWIAFVTCSMVYRIFLSCPIFGKYPYFIALVSVLSNMNSLNSPQSCFFKTNSIIIFPHMSWSSKWFLSFAFSHQTYLCVSLLCMPYTLHYNPDFDQLRTWIVRVRSLMDVIHVSVEESQVNVCFIKEQRDTHLILIPKSVICQT